MRCVKVKVAVIKIKKGVKFLCNDSRFLFIALKKDLIIFAFNNFVGKLSKSGG